MSSNRKIVQYPTLRKLATRLRDDLNNKDFVLLYAYKGTGKTRLSMEFKDVGKRKNSGNSDTLYFNAFTEDLFIWDNDLEGDSERVVQLNSVSLFFSGIKELALEENIQAYLGRYADFDFDIDYDRWTISFSKGEQENIKVSVVRRIFLSGACSWRSVSAFLMAIPLMPGSNISTLTTPSPPLMTTTLSLWRAIWQNCCERKGPL